MLKDVTLALWFFLPTGVANVAPILAAKLPVLRRWDTPMDRGARFHGKQLLGPHKTWRGLIAGVVLGTIAFWLQQLMLRHTQLGWLGRGINYATLPTLVLGPLFGIGALGADALKSFFKRQRGTPSGHTWFPFDQSDYIIGSIISTVLVVQLRPLVYIYAVLLWSLLSLVSSYVGHKLSLKERPI